MIHAWVLIKTTATTSNWKSPWHCVVLVTPTLVKVASNQIQDYAFKKLRGTTLKFMKERERVGVIINFKDGWLAEIELKKWLDFHQSISKLLQLVVACKFWQYMALLLCLSCHTGQSYCHVSLGSLLHMTKICLFLFFFLKEPSGKILDTGPNSISIYKLLFG